MWLVSPRILRRCVLMTFQLRYYHQSLNILQLGWVIEAPNTASVGFPLLDPRHRTPPTPAIM